MLIDNQTLFYRALNNVRTSKKHCKDSPTEESKCYSVDCGQRLLDEYEIEQKESPSKQRPQHQLWEQQDLQTINQLPTSKSCHHKASKCGNANTSKITSLQRSGKRISTASMPDLHRSTLFPSSRTPICKSTKYSHQRSITPTPWTHLGTGIRGSQATQPSTTGSNRKCRCQISASTPTQAQSLGSKRKLRSFGKSLQSLEDERFHK